jgi:hypothetical protein
MFLFVASLPFLYIYATGYRFDIDTPTNLISTGGIYVAAERTGADIYIDDELVRETRVFRRAFYAQNLDPKTHRVHVQKEGHHTWVKELPVSAHLVTEAQAFNLLLVPNVRIIAPWESATGTEIVKGDLLIASTTNATLATTTVATTTFTHNIEYEALIKNFVSTTSTSTLKSVKVKTVNANVSTTTDDANTSTTTVLSNGVRLYTELGELYAEWFGPFENMPYYYCALPFPRYSSSTETPSTAPMVEPVPATVEIDSQLYGPEEESVHPVETVPAGVTCSQKIKMNRKGQAISSFDFFPGSTDLVLMALEDGVYVAEIDNRSWQNVQPLIMGNHLKMHIENGSIYVYDGNLIYQIIQES